MAKPLKTVLQNLETSFYFKVGDVWTANLEQARDFETTEKAMQFCVERKLDPSRFHVLRKSIDEPVPLPRPKPAWNKRRAAE